MNYRKLRYKPLDVVIRYGLDLQRDSWSVRIDDADNWDWRTNQRPPIYANEDDSATLEEVEDVVDHILHYTRGSPTHRTPLRDLLICAFQIRDT